ncbi:hypothetical protein SDC9_91055 [bioreactor metagenome]|uniref:Flagellin N-terminal domain-containing protein n=1 Tax=bioreactor metagenome TaxID=1076179 RepID=A0A644ZUD6_9ZZZZ
MRITTNQVLQNYQRNLSNSNNELNSTMNKVLTNRNFSKASEDPAAASKAFKLRKEYLANEDYIDNVGSVISNYDAVESSTMQMSTIVKEANALVLQGIDGSTSLSQRTTIATSLRTMQESLVLSANSKLGDSFLFGGQNTSTAPFELSNGRLLYFGNDVGSTDATVQSELEGMSNEEVYVDIGLGLSFESGTMNKNTAFNKAESGLNALGFGTEGGVDKNIVNILGDLADEFEQTTLDETKIKQLTDQLTVSKDGLTDYLAELGTKSNFLEKTESRLTDTKTNLNDKISTLENVNMAEAITNYSWAQYAYNAALKVGNGILSQSFIDFMS